MPPPITPQSLHVWFISTAQNLEHRTLFWFSASNVASYILYYSTGWHWMHGTKTKSGAPNSWLCSFPKNWGLFLITPQQRDTDNITLVYGCMVLGYMVFLAIFRLFGNLENVFLWNFGLIVISAIWSILPGQNRGPYITPSILCVGPRHTWLGLACNLISQKGFGRVAFSRILCASDRECGGYSQPFQTISETWGGLSLGLLTVKRASKLISYQTILSLHSWSMPDSIFHCFYLLLPRSWPWISSSHKTSTQSWCRTLAACSTSSSAVTR